MKQSILASKITAAVSNLGLTDHELCGKIDISPSTLSSYKTGRNFPSKENITRILNHLSAHPAHYEAILTHYLIESAPKGYSDTIHHLIKEALEEPQTFINDEIKDENHTLKNPHTELEAALQKLLSKATGNGKKSGKKHVRDLLTILSSDGLMRLKSGV
jgi:transcriptional regulator with XRE-family HTH domain